MFAGAGVFASIIGSLTVRIGPKGLKVYVCRKTISNDGQVKSFVDDLFMERGTVSMRVALVLRSAEVLPLFL